MIQLPDDVISKGYIQTRQFHYSQVFYSPSKCFTGTEEDFVKAGHGYKYIQINNYTRMVVE